MPIGTGEFCDDLGADAVDVAAGGKIHHRVGPVLEGDAQLAQLALGVARYGAVADVRVDLASKRDADAHRLEVRVVHVRRDDEPPARYLVANDGRLDALARGDVRHLLGDDALAGIVHLGPALIARALRDPQASHGTRC